MIRRAVPYSVLPLALIACALASSPWLRAYPSSVLAVPLFGASVLSVLVPVVTVGIGLHKVWQTSLVGLVIFVFYTLLVALHEPAGFADLYRGIAHGPSQLLTFALPLVSPRTLLVAPVTLCWLSGAVVGECVARTWHSVLPYATLIVTFGLAYAGTARAAPSAGDGRRYDTLLAGGLLVVLLLMRAVQAWIEQDLDSASAQPDGRLPLRGLTIGAALSVLVTLAAGVLVQASAFSGPPAAPERTPPLDRSSPLTPVSFVAGLRPNDPRSPGRNLFTVSLSHRTSAYIAIADVDYYDGDGWSFSRTFRPSGGVIPAETDPTLRTPAAPVTQMYRIAKGPLTGAPWMPFLYRPERVTGMSVDTDTASGMVVPSQRLGAGTRYIVRSTATPTDFSQLPATSVVATSTPPNYLAVPGEVGRSLGAVVTSLEDETGTRSGDPIAFLQALIHDLRTNYALAGTPTTAAGPSGAPASSPSGTPGPTAGRNRNGGTGFANVLASILGPNRTATPEQYATLVALVARQLGVPTRLVAGFRLGDAPTVAAGTHRVTSGDAWTWVEVPVQGQGWVVLDPSPARYGGQKKPPSASARPSSSPTPTITPNGLVTQADRSGHAVAPKSTIPHTAGIGTATLALLIGAVVLTTLLLVLLALVARKRLRVRRRRHSGDPRRRLVGAWQESLDILVESGLPDLSSLTSAEVAEFTHEQFGEESAVQARYIGDSANAAIFSPTSWIEPADADAAWHAQRVLRRSVRSRLSWTQRVGSELRFHRAPRIRPLAAPASWAAAARDRNSGRATRHRGARRHRGASRHRAH